MRVCMIGSGYVGLVSGACFADFGHDVICVDKDAGRSTRCRRGEMPIFEPGLDAPGRQTTSRPAACPSPPISPSAVAQGRRRVHRRRHAVAARRRPCRPVLCLRGRREIAGGARRLHRRRHQVDRAGRHRRRGRADHPRDQPDADFAVVSNPEFLREGAAIDDFKRPDRIVVGTEDERGARGDARGLPAAVPQPGADPVHRPAHVRADQIRRQRLPGDEDHLHQRDRRPLRKRRRRRAGRRARHRPRQPHRRQIPASPAPAMAARAFPRTRWRLLKTAQDCRHAGAPDRDHGRGQRPAQARHGPQGDRGAAAATSEARPSPCSA